MKKLLLSILSFLFFASVNAQLIFSEPFNYTTGDLNLQGGWSIGQGFTYPFQVVSNGLTFTGYPLSGSDNAVSIAGNASDVEQESSGIGSAVSSGSLYCSFLLNVTTAPVIEDMILGFTPSLNSPTYLAGRLYIQSNGTGGLSFGIHPGLDQYSQGSTGYVYSYGVTYLMIMKYTFVAGVDNNELSLFVIPTGNTIPTVEPTATLAPVAVAGGSGDDMDDINRICLLARNASVVATIDGIQVADSWTDLFPAATSIAKANEVSQITVYPNPSHDIMYFSKPVSVELLNMDGKIVYSNEESETIHLSSFQEGAYILKCTLGNITEHKLIMVK